MSPSRISLEFPDRAIRGGSTPRTGVSRAGAAFRLGDVTADVTSDVCGRSVARREPPGACPAPRGAGSRRPRRQAGRAGPALGASRTVAVSSASSGARPARQADPTPPDRQHCTGKTGYRTGTAGRGGVPGGYAGERRCTGRVRRGDGAGMVGSRVWGRQGDKGVHIVIERYRVGNLRTPVFSW